MENNIASSDDIPCLICPCSLIRICLKLFVVNLSGLSGSTMSCWTSAKLLAKLITSTKTLTSDPNITLCPMWVKLLIIGWARYSEEYIQLRHTARPCYGST